MRWGDGVTPGKGEAGENIVMVGIGEGDGLGDRDGYACATVRAGGPSVMVAEGLGTQPTGLALGPNGDTLFVADAGEDVVRAIALTARDIGTSSPRSALATSFELHWLPRPGAGVIYACIGRSRRTDSRKPRSV